MSKVKEQVKYNPSYSLKKRADKVRYAVSGGTTTALNAFFIIFALIMLGCVIFGSALDKDFLEGDGSTLMMFMCNTCFMTFMAFVLNGVFPANKAQKQATANKDGCWSIYKLYSHLPLTKLSVVKTSFKYFFIGLTAINLASIALNVFVYVIDGYEFAKGVLGLMSVVFAIVFVLIYFFNFSKYIKEPSKLFGNIITCVVIGFYILWWGSMFNALKPVYELKIFEMLGGIPAIVITVLSQIVIMAIEKFYIEKKSKGASWNDV